MNVCKKLSALTFVLALALALSVSAFASSAAELTNGKVGSGGLTTTAAGTTVNLKKDIIVYNATAHTADIPAPAFSYTYTVRPATVASGTTVTDEATPAVSAPVKAGLTTSLTVTGQGGSTGTAGTAASAVGTLAFTNSTTFSADSSVNATSTNTYNIALDFSSVIFPQPGVYRYEIEETLADSATYDGLYMQDGNVNTVYLDVYVDGNLAIYGYVCLTENASVTSATTTKVNGFVYSATAAQNGADSYFTYDLTLRKTVSGDTFAQTHGFPFTVIFTGMSANFAIVETPTAASGSETAGFSPSSTNSWKGIAKIVHGESIAYTGIPCGVDVEVYETNDMNGVTYQVTTTVNGTAKDAESVVSTTTAPTTAETQSNPKADYQSTKETFTTTLATAVTTAQTYAVTNALVNISPTGVTLRYAPYLLTLGAGVTALPLTRRYKKREEEV